MMSLSFLLMAALVAGTDDYRNAVDRVLRITPEDHGVTPLTKPDFCKSLECPLYTVINKTGTYELREYESVLWVQTRVTDVDFSTAMNMNFWKLFRYIQGNNDKKEKIPMTVPVINKIKPGEGPACESDFTMSFYLTQNSSQFNNYPKPTDSAVSVTTMNKFRAYVRQFGGYYVRYDAWRQEALKLADDIGDQSKYVQDYWYIGGYDSPFTLFNRHNEIWFMAV